MTDTAVTQAELIPVKGPAPRSFIEVQFPVAKVSAESYSERKGAQGQTLTGLGKWWGRKPLILVRAIIIGLLMPATDDPARDREVFLALLTMDDDGLMRRWTKSLSAKDVGELLPPGTAAEAVSRNGASVSWRTGLTTEERKGFQARAFRSLPYDKKLEYCSRPEEIDGPSLAAWERINAHLGTAASSLPELVRELGERRWGHTLRVGDAFCGGGSIPFEAARLGCNVYASDINPVAGLLTWGALNIVGGGPEVVERVKAAQRRVYDAVKAQVDEWGIESNEQGEVADAYLYCNEVVDPNTGWTVPLAPSWVIARRADQVIARLIPDPANRRFDIEVVNGVSAGELRQAEEEGTAKGGIQSPVNRDGAWLLPTQRHATRVEQLRGPGGLRRWTISDIVPRPGDVYQERLYCIRWVDPKTGKRSYRAPSSGDLIRETQVLELLRARFDEWQVEGYIPSRDIEPGSETSRLGRERGWTRWHQLFNPRQLLVNGLVLERTASLLTDQVERAAMLLTVGKLANINSKLCQWHSARDQTAHTFYNQSLNTMVSYSTRGSSMLASAFQTSDSGSLVQGLVQLTDARSLATCMDAWITDPGYGDTILYDEISEYFLAWYEKTLPRLFPDWYTDSRRALNLKGEGEQFRLGLTQAYSSLADNMSEGAFQVVMFPHQDPSVWADVGLTMWASGLQVTGAWTIATETPSTGIKGGGNWVQGTVCLVLKKRTSDVTGYLSDIHPEIQREVRRQIEAMTALDDTADPSFGDADYQLAAYAAALRVLTAYSSIDEIDIQRELRRPRERGVTSPITKLIEQAVRIASDSIVPPGIDKTAWRKLGPEERLYLKGIETEAGGEAREGVYQELARSYGAGPHKDLYASRAANRVRFKTASEFGSRDLGRVGEPEFAGSTLRRLLYAVYATASHDERDPRNARLALRTEIPDYWSTRTHLVELLAFLIRHTQSLPHWTTDTAAMRLLQASLDHDAV